MRVSHVVPFSLTAHPIMHVKPKSYVLRKSTVYSLDASWLYHCMRCAYM